MSTETQEPIEMGTKPVQEHKWLQKLVGEWRVKTEMTMGPGQPKRESQGTESVKSLGGLWAFGEGKAKMPDGIFLATADLVLEDDIARAAHDRRVEPRTFGSVKTGR